MNGHLRATTPQQLMQATSLVFTAAAYYADRDAREASRLLNDTDICPASLLECAIGAITSMASVLASVSREPDGEVPTPTQFLSRQALLLLDQAKEYQR